MVTSINPPSPPPAARKATQFETDNFELGLKIQQMLAPRGYTDKRAVGVTAIRQPYLLRSTITDLTELVIDSRKNYRRQLINGVTECREVTEAQIAQAQAWLDKERAKPFYKKSRSIIKQLVTRIECLKAQDAAYHKVIDILKD